MPRRTTLLVLALAVALGLSGAALSKNKPGKPPHHPKGPAHHHAYAWHDVSNRRLQRAPARPVRPQQEQGLGQRVHPRDGAGQGVPHPRPGRDLAGRQPGRHTSDPAVPRHRGVRREPCRGSLFRHGTDSSIYRTADGGQTWTLVFQNAEPNAFYDCMTFFNRKVGLAVSDPPDGLKFRIIKTTDGGRTWNIVDPAGMPPALPGEFAFAASGQCLTSNHGHTAWLGTGGGAQARVFTSRNRGRTWTVASTPILERAERGHLRARLQEPAARARSRRRLRRADGLAEQLREDDRRRPELVAPDRRTG